MTDKEKAIAYWKENVKYLVGLLAVAIDPSGALLAGAALLAVFGTAFALDQSAVRTHAYALTHAHLGGAGRLLRVDVRPRLGHDGPGRG